MDRPISTTVPAATSTARGAPRPTAAGGDTGAAFLSLMMRARSQIDAPDVQAPPVDNETESGTSTSDAAGAEGESVTERDADDMRASAEDQPSNPASVSTAVAPDDAPGGERSEPSRSMPPMGGQLVTTVGAEAAEVGTPSESIVFPRAIHPNDGPEDESSALVRFNSVANGPTPGAIVRNEAGTVTDAELVRPATTAVAPGSGDSTRRDGAQDAVIGASARDPVPLGTLRPGQIAGDAVHGIPMPPSSTDRVVNSSGSDDVRSTDTAGRTNREVSANLHDVTASGQTDIGTAQTRSGERPPGGDSRLATPSDMVRLSALGGIVPSGTAPSTAPLFAVGPNLSESKPGLAPATVDTNFVQGARTRGAATPGPADMPPPQTLYGREHTRASQAFHPHGQGQWDGLLRSVAPVDGPIPAVARDLAADTARVPAAPTALALAPSAVPAQVTFATAAAIGESVDPDAISAAPDTIFAAEQRAVQSTVPAVPISSPQAAPAAVPPPAVEQVMRAMTGLGDRAIEIALSPEELGRVRMTLATVDGGLTLMIHAEREDTLALLRRNMDLLGNELRDLGFKTLSFQFSQDGQGHEKQPGSGGETAASDGPHPDHADPAASRQRSADTTPARLDIRL